MDDLRKAQEMFGVLCRTLEDNDWNYKKNEEALTIECGAQGEDLPIELRIEVDAERKLVILLSTIPARIPEDKRLDAAVAVSVVNNILVDGCFDYNVKTGNLLFRMTNSYMESTLSKEVFDYMLFCSCKTIDDYNDKFFALAKNMMTIQQFIAWAMSDKN